VLVDAPAGRVAVGLKFSDGLLFVAGGSTGRGYVYDAGTGESLAEFSFATGSTFVNDVVVTDNAAWFTDSFNPALYKVPLQAGLPDPGDVETVPLTVTSGSKMASTSTASMPASTERLW
jgi:hypothetical protein